MSKNGHNALAMIKIPISNLVYSTRIRTPSGNTLYLCSEVLSRDTGHPE
jgi:hypothetical protein